MKALDRKVLRDLRLLWSQALTIALVVASGIGGFVGMSGFGASGAEADLARHFGLTPERVVEEVRARL